MTDRRTFRSGSGKKWVSSECSRRLLRELVDDDDGGIAEVGSAGCAPGEPEGSVEGEVADAGTCTRLGRGRG